MVPAFALPAGFPAVDLAGPAALPSPAIVGPAGPGFVCLTGVVTLFQFIRPPEPGSIIGTLTTLDGRQVAIVQTQPALASGVTLGAADRQLATVCGNLVFAQGQLALDVRFVAPGVSPFTPGGLPFGALFPPGSIGLPFAPGI